MLGSFRGYVSRGYASSQFTMKQVRSSCATAWPADEAPGRASMKQGPAGGSCASCDDGHGASESGSSYANAQAMFADPLPSAHRPEGTTSSVVGRENCKPSTL